MNIQYIEIAGVSLRFHTRYFLQSVDAFQPFIRNEAKNPWDIQFVSVKSLPLLTGKIIYRCQEYAVYHNDNKEYIRVFFDLLDEGKPYAVTRLDVSKRQIRILYLEEKEKYFSEWNNSFFHIGLEQILLHEKRFVLHASCVQTPLGGIMFSGVSGVGKSTQAELWCRYAKGRLINGDRPIIGNDNNQWKAYGSPYAGSSRCYRNESCLIRTVVMLEQAGVSSIRRLSASEAFRRMFAGTTVNIWDSEFLNRVCNLETEFVQQIPIYELCCTPDQDAVRLLWRTLEGGM